MTLANLRAEIDQIDAQIVTLVEKRLEIVSEIAEDKRARAAAVYDAERERALFERIGRLASEKNRKALVALYRMMTALSRSQELGQSPREASQARAFRAKLPSALPAAELLIMLLAHEVEIEVLTVEQAQCMFRARSPLPPTFLTDCREHGIALEAVEQDQFAEMVEL